MAVSHNVGEKQNAKCNSQQLNTNLMCFIGMEFTQPI